MAIKLRNTKTEYRNIKIEYPETGSEYRNTAIKYHSNGIKYQVAKIEAIYQDREHIGVQSRKDDRQIGRDHGPRE